MATSPGLESLIARYNLTQEDVEKQISDIHIEVISRSWCKKWRHLCAHLELDFIVADDIESQKVDEDQNRLKFFTTWKAKQGSEATYKKLISALQTIGCNDDAEHVCELSQSVRVPPQQQQQLKEQERQEMQLQKQKPEQHSAQPDNAGN